MQFTLKKLKKDSNKDKVKHKFDINNENNEENNNEDNNTEDNNEESNDKLKTEIDDNRQKEKNAQNIPNTGIKDVKGKWVSLIVLYSVIFNVL